VIYGSSASAKRLRRAALGVSALGLIGASYAYHLAFYRPGESALRLLPKGADFFGSIDFVPSPSQVMAFAHLESSLKQTGHKVSLQQLVASALFSDDKMAAAMQPFIGRSGAFAWYSHTKKGDDAAILIAVTDNDGAERALGSSLTSKTDATGTYYASSNGWDFRLIPGYLEATHSPDMFAKLSDVQNGRAPSILTATTITALKKVDSDANVKVFGQSGGTLYVSMSAKIDENGLEVKVNTVPGTVHFMPALAPASPTALHKIPGGAYAAFTVTGLGPLLATMGNIPGWTKGDSNGLKGDLVVAAYPSVAKPAYGLDLLMMTDTANGAKPTAMITDLLAMAKKNFTDGAPIFDKPHHEGTALVYRLTPSLHGMLHKVMTSTDSDDFDVKRLLKNSTVTYAVDGGTVFCASSDALLHRTLSAYHGKTLSLAEDVAFRPQQKQIADGAQLTVGLDTWRLNDGLNNSMKPTSPAWPQIKEVTKAILSPADLINLHLNNRKNDSYDAGIYIPLNYGALGKVLAENASN
jgi:hypothetical protein